MPPGKRIARAFTENIGRSETTFLRYFYVSAFFLRSKVFMKKNLLIPEMNLFEKSLWAFSLIGITVLFLIVPEKNPLTFVATLIGVTSLIFTAKGHVSGQFLMIVFCVLYAIVSLGFRYYGEAITYLFMTLPSDIVSTIVWLKNPSTNGKREVKMAHLTPRKTMIATAFTFAATFVFYFVLRALNTTNLEISTISIATSMIASVFTIMRLPYYALGYAANDIVLIAMWILASLENPVYITMVLNFVIFLANDLYGFYSWKKIRRTQDA